jgi:hypothetical protein
VPCRQGGAVCGCAGAWRTKPAKPTERRAAVAGGIIQTKLRKALRMELNGGLAHPQLEYSPYSDREGEPHREGSCKDHCGIVERQELPYHTAKRGKCEGARRCAAGIQGGPQSPSNRLGNSGAPLLVTSVLFDQRRTRRKDGWKREKQASDHRSEVFGDQTRRHGNSRRREKTA